MIILRASPLFDGRCECSRTRPRAAESPGGTTMVVAGSSTIAGPSMAKSAGSRSRAIDGRIVDALLVEIDAPRRRKRTCGRAACRLDARQLQLGAIATPAAWKLTSSTGTERRKLYSRSCASWNRSIVRAMMSAPWPVGQIDFHAVFLAAIAHVGVAQERKTVRNTVGAEFTFQGLYQLVERRCDCAGRFRLDAHQAGADRVAPHVGHQHAPGGEDRGIHRDDHFRNAELARQRGRMHAATAAERDQREVARIEPAIERDQLERIHHVGVGDPDHAARALLDRHAEPAGERSEGAPNVLHVGCDLALQEQCRIDASGDQVGVGRGRLGPATAVRRRPRHRAGAARPDMQLPARVDPGDAAAAIADLDQIEHRYLDRIARIGARPLELVVGGDARAGVLDQRALRGRAADVECDQVRLRR